MTLYTREYETATVTVDTDRGTGSIKPMSPPPPDNPPTIRITKPARAGKSFKSQVTIQAVASSDTVRAEIVFDDQIWVDWAFGIGAVRSMTYLWKPGKKVKPGKHKIEVRAYDATGRSAVARTWVKRVGTGS